MADYQVRNWIAWRHHQVLSRLAAWFQNLETRRGKKPDGGADQPQVRQLIAGTIEEHLMVNDRDVSCRRSTRWLVRIEKARFYFHRSRRVLPALKNNLRI